jgi:hypothetical protein
MKAFADVGVVTNIAYDIIPNVPPSPFRAVVGVVTNNAAIPCHINRSR